MRHKLERWKLPGIPMHHARRALSRLKELRELVAPRVVSACFRLIYNGWCTPARFQKKGSCVLCSKRDSEDRIEHYPYCSRVRALMVHHLGMSNESACLESFLFVSSRADAETHTLLAIVVYAVFRATHYLRSGCLQDAPEIDQMLWQFCTSAKHNHMNSSKSLDFAVFGRYAI